MEHLLPEDLREMVRRLNAAGHLRSELRRVRGREQPDAPPKHHDASAKARRVAVVEVR